MSYSCISVAFGQSIYLFGGYNNIEKHHYGDILKLDTGNAISLGLKHSFLSEDDVIYFTFKQKQDSGVQLPFLANIRVHEGGIAVVWWEIKQLSLVDRGTEYSM